MSMHTSGGSTLCCIIKDREDIDSFIEKYIDLNPADFDSPEYKDRKVARSDMEMWLCCNEAFIYGADAGDAEGRRFSAEFMVADTYYPLVYYMPLADGLEYTSVDLPLICVPAEKGCFAKTVLNGSFYKDKSELTSEFKEKLGQYLPKDFNWEENIGNLEYALCC